MKIKKYLMGLIAICSLFMFIPTIKAETEKQCITYENYYFFIAINTKNYLNSNAGEIYDKTTYDYFPQPDVPINWTESTRNRAICLKKNDSDTRCEGQPYVKDLSWYYRNFINAATSSTVIGIISPRSSTPSNSKVYIESEGNIVRRYYTHGKWYEIKDNGEVNEHSGVADILSSEENLINSSVLPAKEEIPVNTISMDWENNNDYITGTISRYLTLPASGTSEYPSFYGVKWQPSDSTTTQSWLLPQLGFITYKVCTETNEDGEPVYYNAKIDYVYEDGSQAADSYVIDNLPNAYIENVKSPVIKGCTTDNKDYVNIKIDEVNPEDFYEQVVYTCSGSHPTTPSKPTPDKTDNELDSPGDTGDALIYVAWFVGLAAIGFVVYYYFKERKAKSEL